MSSNRRLLLLLVVVVVVVAVTSVTSSVTMVSASTEYETNVTFVPSTATTPTSTPVSLEAAKCGNACGNVAIAPAYREVTCANLVARGCVCPTPYLTKCAERWTMEGSISICTLGVDGLWERFTVEKRGGMLFPVLTVRGTIERIVCADTVNEHSADDA